jgi:hypothetical protein
MFHMHQEPSLKNIDGSSALLKKRKKREEKRREGKL